MSEIVLSYLDVCSRYGVKEKFSDVDADTFDCRGALMVASATHELIRHNPTAHYILSDEDQVETIEMILQWMREDERQIVPPITYEIKESE